MGNLIFKHIKETLKKEAALWEICMSVVFLCIFLASISCIKDAFMSAFLCGICAYVIVYSITKIIIIYLDLRIDYWRQRIHNRACSTYKELIEFRKEYNMKYIETREFNEVFELLITSSNKYIVSKACEYFKNYKRFGCKDKDNKFIIALFTYIYDVERLDERYLFIHRNNIN